MVLRDDAAKGIPNSEFRKLLQLCKEMSFTEVQLVTFDSLPDSGSTSGPATDPVTKYAITYKRTVAANMFRSIPFRKCKNCRK